MAYKYIIIKKNAQEEMETRFNRPAGLPQGDQLDELCPVQENNYGITGFWFNYTNASKHLGLGRVSIDSFCSTLSQEPTHNICIIETDTPEEYGLVLPLIEQPEI